MPTISRMPELDAPQDLGEPHPLAFDEMVTGDGQLRSHWRGFMGAIGALPKGTLHERAERARLQFAEDGVTYNIYADPHEAGRNWRFDIIPLLIDGQEWNALEAGLVQRADLLDRLLQDLYGPQSLLAAGLVPPALVFGSDEFLRPLRFAQPFGRPYLHVYAADLIRGPDGRWQVMADRVQAPSGAGYALGNRRVLARSFGEAFKSSSIRGIRPFFELWSTSLQAAATASGPGRPVLLTPGPLNETYFEHVYLAREMGLTLVEGADLTVRNGDAFLRTLRRLEPVTAILRRIDSKFADPLELRPDSTLGAVGLIDAIRNGRLTMVNALGAGVVESAAIAGRLEKLAGRLLGEPLLLPTLPADWLGECAMPGDLEDLIIYDALRPGRAARMPAQMAPAERQELLAAMQARPEQYAVRRRVAGSVAPSLAANGLWPRPIVLRCFLVRYEGEWVAMPGGLARVPMGPDVQLATMQNGSIAKDVWIVQGEKPDVLIPALGGGGEPAKVRRTPGELPSRAADNLFWLGRYSERLDQSVRLLRMALTRLVIGAAGPRDLAELSAIARLLSDAGVIDADMAQGPAHGRQLAQAITEACEPGRAIHEALAQIGRNGSSVRDRLSTDMWNLISHLTGEMIRRLGEAKGNADRLLGVLEALTRSMSAFAGMAAENMTRATGWHYLDFGRRLERAVYISRGIEGLCVKGYCGGEAALRLALELADSTITYRTRYLAALERGLVLDLILADETNPRAVSFQFQALQSHLDALVAEGSLHSVENERLLVEDAAAAVETIDFSGWRQPGAGQVQDQVLAAVLRQIQERLMMLSDTIARGHFVHVAPPSFSIGFEGYAS